MQDARGLTQFETRHIRCHQRKDCYGYFESLFRFVQTNHARRIGGLAFVVLCARGCSQADGDAGLERSELRLLQRLDCSPGEK